MPKPFNELRERLLWAGVAPRHVKRYLKELTDHLTDLRAEEERAGRTRQDAEAAALARLGSVDDLTNAMIRRRQFQSWSVRAPWATFGILPMALGLLHRMFHSVVRLENVSARRRHAIRQRSGPNSDPFAREHLFSNRQADLLHRADSSWLGNWTHCCPTKIESGLAHCRFGPDRVDGCHRRNSSQSDIGPRRIRTHQNEFLQSSYFWSVYFR